MASTQVIQLRPTEEQEQYFLRCCGTMRFVYNQLVERARVKKEKYNRREFQRFCIDLRQETDWMQEVTARATYEAADNFHRSMQNFFDSCKGKRKGKKISFPTFKKRGSKDSFHYSHPTQFKIDGRELQIQGLKKQKIQMRERIRFTGTVKSVTIKRRGKNWFASFLVDAELKARPSNGAREPIVGVDLGLTTFAVLSTGERIENPRLLQAKLKLLARRQRQLSRKVNGSNRREIAKQRVATIHKVVADRRAAFHQQAVNHLIDNFDKIVIEDLHITGMIKNRRLAKSISDVGWGEWREILTYKAKANGNEIVVADRFFPSSKTDHKTGEYLPDLKLSDRSIHHKDGAITDRDLNAAINLANYNETTSLQIRERRKTYRRDKSDLMASIVVDAVNTEKLEMTNTNNKPRTLHNAHNEQTATVY